MSHSTQVIYEKHHQHSRGEGFSIMEKDRGDLLHQAIGKGQRVLDVGCRDGALTKYFAEDNEVLGVDIDEQALGRASRDLGIKTIIMDLNSDWSEVAGLAFDKVVAGEVLEHLYYPDEVVKKINHHLKPGGLLVGSVPNAFSFKNRLRYLMGKKRHTPLADPTHINHFSYIELKKMLEKYYTSVEIIGLGRYSKLSRIFPNAIAFDLFFKAIK